MLEKIKLRCGIAKQVTVYDEEIAGYIDDARADLIDSGVPPDQVETPDERIVTAITLYVKANIGDDRSDTEVYMDMYRKKVFRLALVAGEE